MFISCQKSNKSNPLENTNLNSSYVYMNNGIYKNVLPKCIKAKTYSSSCTLETLPFIIQENSNITKKLIMQRVVVSHDWMAIRFSEMLDVLPNDIKQLLGSTTSIFIHKNIKLSYYWSLTGAIYLDPRYLVVNTNRS